MNKKISQFEVTSKLNEHDILTVVQDGENKNITGAILNTSLSETFATNERVDGIEQDVTDLSKIVGDNYVDLSNQIVEGDQTVTKNVTGTMNEYYDVLNNTIITLEKKHDADMSEIGGTVQEWIDDIDNRSTLDQLKDALNKITVLENLVTALAEQIASGGGGGSVPGFHTQGTNTIFPLTGYYYTGDATPLTTTDTLNQALSKLEGQVKHVEASVGGDTKYVIKTGDNTQATDGNLYSALRSDQNYLSATTDDTANGYIKFLRGIQGGDTFREGFMGEGASLWPINGKWKMEVDDLFVRGQMTVNELIVNEIKATGGDILVSIADMKIIAVERDAEGDYKCFFDNENGTRYNQFRPGDQAICQIFDGQNVKRYWRLVKETGADYIILSQTVCEPNSAEPEVGDNVLQLGNRYPDGADRRSAIMISAKGSNGPSITMYDNIDDFNLVNKARTTIGKDSKFVGTLTQVDGNGDLIRVPIDKGEYIAGTTYYYYDRVSYQGSLWLCIAISTVNPPSKENEEWLLQVEKGEAGAAGDDKAKWVEILGDRLFMYDNPEFKGTPTPSTLELLCNTYNVENPIYEWTNKITKEVLSTEVALSVRPEMFGEDRNMMIRCTVTSGKEIFYDEVQLAKLGDGAQGADAYYIDLSNGTVAVPYDSSGNNPLINLEGVYTDVYAYHGITQIAIQDIKANVTSGIAQVSVSGNRISLTALGSPNARITLTIQADNIIFTKDWYINKVSNGEDGFDGVDASYVLLSGEQVFKYSGDGSVSPTAINLYATAYNLTNPKYKWWWSIAGNNSWTELINEVTNQIIVSPNGSYFTNADEVTFKVIATSEFGGVEYMDMMTINKIYDGKDGISPYRATLSNESHTVAAQYDGTTTTAELNKAKTSYALYQGITKLESSQFSVRWTNLDNNTENQLSQDTSNQTLTLARLGSNYDSTVFKVEFCVPANSNTVVDTVDFSITKAKGGIPGDFEITIYCRSNEAQPATPTITSRPTSSGVYNQGNYWYDTAPSAGAYAIWASTALFDGTTGQRKTGEVWTVPTKISGKDGENGKDGERGPQGIEGPAGPTGPLGPTGPGLNFKGEYNPSSYYYYTTELRDVVYKSTTGNYYAVKNKGTVTPNWSDSEWTVLNSFASIATGLLFAEEATIAGWSFSNSYIYANNRTAYLNANASVYSPTIGIGTNALAVRTIKGTVTSISELPATANIGDAYWYGNPRTTTYGWNGKQWIDIKNSTSIPSDNAAIKIYNDGHITLGDGTVAGNAGISGIGSSASNVRFWAGAAFGNRDSAPFRVTHEGKMYASGADISGKITATTGKIGGFTIESNAFRGDSLSLTSGTSGSLYFSRTTSAGTYRAGIGLNTVSSTFGDDIPLTISVNKPSNAMDVYSYGGSISASGAYRNHALALSGGFLHRGASSQAKTVLIDAQPGDKLGYIEDFILTSSSNNKYFSLPTSAELKNAYKGWAADKGGNQGSDVSNGAVIRFRFFCSNASNVYIRGTSSTPLKDWNANVTELTLERGDSCELMHYYGSWFIISYTH